MFESGKYYLIFKILKIKLCTENYPNFLIKSQARSRYPPLQPLCPLLLQESRCCALSSTASAPLLMIANLSDATSAVDTAQDAPHHP